MLLGQHALAYVVAVYGAQVLRVRILSFHLPEQSLHVLGLAMVAACMTLLLNMLLGADFPGLAYFVSPVLTAALWGPATAILYAPAVRRRREAPP
jgi:rod shape-determining protein MreD